MSRDTFLSRDAPSEVLVLVLGNCASFRDILSLALTCKHLHSVWRANGPAVLHTVARRCVPAFDIALLAVRAIEIAKDAFLASILPPPDLDISHLLSLSPRPKLSEMQAIFSLERFAGVFEEQYLRGGTSWDSYRNENEQENLQPPDGLPNREEWDIGCKEPFRRAVYRILLVGPLLARIYQEPFCMNGSLHQPLHKFLDEFFIFRKPEDDDDDWFGSELVEKDVEYLAHFPVFDQSAHIRMDKRLDSVFGSIADWIVRSARASITEEVREYFLERMKLTLTRSRRQLIPSLDHLGHQDEKSEAETRFILREIIQMMHVYEHMTRCFVNANGWGAQSGFRHKTKDLVALDAVENPRKTIPILFPEVYQLEFVTISEGSDHEAGTLRLLVTGIPDPEKGQNGTPSGHPGLVDIDSVLYSLYCSSRRPNHINGYPSAPPGFHLSDFILRRQFGVRFEDRTWDQHPSSRYTYDSNFLMNGSIWQVYPCQPTDTGFWPIDLAILDNLCPDPVLSYKQLP